MLNRPQTPPLVILDRDGVINADAPEHIKTADELIPIPGSLEAIAKLKQAGFRVAVATNQSGLARGLFDRTALQQMHTKLQQLLYPLGGAIDLIRFCPHDPHERCPCRKPAPGLLDEIADHFGLTSLAGVPLVGDSHRDLVAARARKCAPILVHTGNGRHTAQAHTLPDTIQCADLAEAADTILRLIATDTHTA